MAAFEAYINNLVNEMREAKRQADKYDREWNELNDAFTRKHWAEDVRRRSAGAAPKSELMKDEEKSTSLALSNAFGAQAWWQGKAEATAAIISAECAVASTLARLLQ